MQVPDLVKSLGRGLLNQTGFASLLPGHPEMVPKRVQRSVWGTLEKSPTGRHITDHCPRMAHGAIRGHFLGEESRHQKGLFHYSLPGRWLFGAPNDHFA